MGITFTGVPKDYGSVFREQIYRMSGFAGDGPVEASVCSPTAADVVGVKRFRPRGTVELNASPYLRRLLSPRPAPPNNTGFATPAGRSVKASVACEGVQSPERTFTAAAADLAGRTVLSTLPMRRTIAWNEYDETDFRTSGGKFVFRWRADGGKCEYVSPEYRISAGLVSFLLVMEEVSMRMERLGTDPATVRRLEVEVACDGQAVSSASYDIVRREDGAVRLAWLNSVGGIDQHTFPAPLSERIDLSRSRVEGPSGAFGVFGGGERRVCLTSGYLPPEWAEGVAEAVCSPLVWRMEPSGKAVPVIVGCETVKLPAGEPGRIDFTVTEAVGMTVRNF